MKNLNIMNALCIASSNPGKLMEIKAILNGFGLTVHSQADFNIQPVAETGSTFVENAIIKARHAGQLSRLPAIADDSGLCIDVLDQAPGIHSAYYAGEKATVENNIQKIIKDIADYKDMPIKAHFVTVICFIKSAIDPIPFLITEILEGEILHEPRGQTRGYDSIFFIPKMGKTLGELSLHEKNKVSARGRAIIKLKQYFKKTVFNRFRAE